MNPDTVGKVADATKAVAETGGKAIDAASSFGGFFRGTLTTVDNLIDNELKFITARRVLTLESKYDAAMKERGLTNPTRTLPTNFLLPLLTHAIFEEDDDLQETWARLLVNAGDSATDMDLRTAYVDILAGMSAFDVRNLSLLGAAALSVPHNPYLLLETWNLPKSANPRSVDGGIVELAPNLAISLGNLARLGCVDLNNSPIFAQFARMTHLGMALYGACR